MSGVAADRIVQIAVEKGMKHAGAQAGVDPASVSRLVAARADRLLHASTRPRVARIGDIGGAVAVSDAWTGNVMACFTGADDSRLIPWLSKPYPGVILPGADMLSRAITWTGFKVAVAVDTAVSMLEPLMERSQKRLTAVDNGDASSLAAHMRHFDRTYGKLKGIMEMPDIATGKQAISDWIRGCTGFWADVFRPILLFLTSYQDCLFSHPACLQADNRMTLDLKGPANLMTLALNMKRLSEPTPPELKMAEPGHGIRLCLHS